MMTAMGEPATVEFEQQPAQAPAASHFVLQGSTKVGLLVLMAALLYLRLALRKRREDRICPHCGKRNPHHRLNCTRCSAPLFHE